MKWQCVLLYYCIIVFVTVLKPASLNAEEKKPLVNSSNESPSHSSLLVVVKQLLPFLGVFGPLVMFWAVFYQQNTTWVVQGTHMDCYMGKLHIPPGQFTGTD